MPNYLTASDILALTCTVDSENRHHRSTASSRELLESPYKMFDTLMPPVCSELKLEKTEHTITPQFAPRKIDFLYAGAITDAGIKELTECVELGFYQYQPILTTVHMRSPGGLARALDYWAYKVRQWQSHGWQIATRADTECASAAAMVVTIGTVGKRFAHPLSQLRFHNPRLITPTGTAILEHDAEVAARMLKESRCHMHGLLKHHLIDSLGTFGFARTLSARAEWLLDEVRSLPSNHLARYAGGPSLLNKVRGMLEGWSKMQLDDPKEAEVLITQWEKQISDIFKLDQIIDLRCAWALLLIDGSDDLPVLIEENMLLASAEKQRDGLLPPQQTAQSLSTSS